MSIHAKISYVKSIIRIIGYLTLIYSLKVGVILLVVSELLGIIEEIYEKK